MNRKSRLRSRPLAAVDAVFFRTSAATSGDALRGVPGVDAQNLPAAKETAKVRSGKRKLVIFRTGFSQVSPIFPTILPRLSELTASLVDNSSECKRFVDLMSLISHSSIHRQMTIASASSYYQCSEIYPLIPAAAMPRINCFWQETNSSTIGTLTITTAAISSDQRSVNCS